MPESIQHHAGRIFQPYYKSLMVKIHITEKDIYSNRTVNNSNRTTRQLTVLLEYISIFSVVVLKSKDVFQLLIMCP